MDNKDFVYFVLKRSPNGRIRSHFGFSAYKDIDGNTIEYHDGKINPNSKIAEPTYFSFSRRHKVMNVKKKAFGKNQYGESLSKVEFLRNHPECEGSPNNTGQMTWFKEMNSEKDVDIALEASEMRRKAETVAAGLQGEELKSAAALYNEVSDSSKKQRFAVLQWAFHNPEKFLATVDSPDFKVRGFIKRALAAKILDKHGSIIRWGSVTIGIDEDDAVHKILSDESIAKSLSKQLRDYEGVPDISVQVEKEIAKSKSEETED